jgi:Protein of unknown function (DUF3570)
MRKIYLTVIGMYLLFLNAFSQAANDTSGNYKNRKLKLEETNLISGYYQQDGYHSAITGGNGTQYLTDVSNIVQLKFIRWDMYDRKHTLDFEGAVDHHTAASSAYVSKTGASNKGGTRIYPSITWKTENEERKSIVGFGLSVSSEYNYHSLGGNLSYAKTSQDGNREFNAKAQIFLDQVKMIQPSELVPQRSYSTILTNTSASGRGGGSTSFLTFFSDDNDRIPSSARNTYMTSFSLSQVINKNAQFSLLADGVAQTGYLGLPFHRVYWTNGSVHVEKLPTSRLKLPLGARFNYFIGDKFIVRTFYRFYTDTWGLKAHSLSIELPYKITSFVSVSPIYRYYQQTAIKYFAPYAQHTSTDYYYTSNYDYSAFSSNYVGINFRIAPPKGVFGIKSFNMLEIRGGRYVQTTGLNANNITVNLRFK